MLKKILAGLTGVGVLTLAAGCAASGSSAAHEIVASQPVVVHVRVLDGQGTPQGARPIVDVRVGNSTPVPVLLDTGSSGLRIFDSAIRTGTGSGVTLTSKKSNITYAGGHRFTGVVADAVVAVGSSPTRLPIAFGYVQRAFCIAAKPTCPASGGMSGFEKSGADGILGIGTQSSGGGIVSPSFGMPAPLGQRWSLHLAGSSGALTLGARATTGATAIPMTKIGSSAGHDLWADSSLPLCVTVGTTSQCVPGLFDSGTYTMQISGSALGRAPTVAGSDHAVSGTPVTVARRGSAHPFWRFTSGPTKSADLVTVKARSGAFVNTGVQVFFDFTVTYDDAAGVVSLSG